MAGLGSLIDQCTKMVRRVMAGVARGLNRMTKGKLSPNTVTIFGLLMHLPIAYLIATEHHVWAAVLLIIFGLFDTLDGELARLQGKVSKLGMLLDSSTDRMKEIILYSGIGYYFVNSASIDAKNVGLFAALTIAACGGSLLVSYINAWGEVLATASKRTSHKVNQSFRTGFLKFEVRMFLLVIGLGFDVLVVAVFAIAVLAWVTAFERLTNVARNLP